MSEVIMYGTRFCPFCIRARHLLDGKGVEYQDIRVDAEPGLRNRMEKLSGRRTVPQIWIGQGHVGGFQELWELERKGRLDPLLTANRID